MTFEQWWATLKNQPIPQLKPDFANCWNEALEAAQNMMLRCCCGHSRSEHTNESWSCTHENCTCVNLCDCWVIVSESAESEHPGILEKHFSPLLAKVTP